MVIPLILGSMLKRILDMNSAPVEIAFFQLAIGFIAAFITGVFACRWMIALVKRSQLSYFALYCLLVGLLALGYELFV